MQSFIFLLFVYTGFSYIDFSDGRYFLENTNLEETVAFVKESSL